LIPQAQKAVAAPQLAVQFAGAAGVQDQVKPSLNRRARRAAAIAYRDSPQVEEAPAAPHGAEHFNAVSCHQGSAEGPGTSSAGSVMALNSFSHAEVAVVADVP
jgi:hypothetical protein